MTPHFSETAFSSVLERKENRRSRRERADLHAAWGLVTHSAALVLLLNHPHLRRLGNGGRVAGMARVLQGVASPVWWMIRAFALVLGLGVTAAAAADGQDLIKSVEMVIDESRALSADAVLARPMTSVEHTVSTGFTQAVLWLKITIDPAPKGEQTVLKVFPNVLDYLTLYRIDAAGHLMAPLRSGDMVPLAERHVPSLITHDFLLPAATQRLTYLLRIETSSGATIRLAAQAADNAASQTLNELLVGSFAMAVKLFSIILLALYGSHLPRRINLVFAATITCFGLVPFVRLGYLQAVFTGMSPEVVSQVTSVTMTLGVGVLLLFLRLFLTPFAPQRLTLVLANAAIGANFLGLPALLFGTQQLATIISAVTLASSVPVTGLMLLTLRRDAYIGRRTVRFIYGAFTGFIALFVLTTFDVLNSGPLYRFSIEFVGIANSTLILALILMLNRSIKRRRHAAELRSLELSLESEALSRTRRFQKRLIDAIAEQSQSTAAEIRRLIAAEPSSGSIPGILDPVMGRISKIIEHCQQAGRIEQGEWRADLSPVDLAEVLADLAKDIAPDRFQISAPEHLVARCDRSLIEVAFGHLMSNASRYSVPGTPIFVQAAVDEQTQVQITISNNLPPESQLEPERLFEKFYRGIHAHSISGTGLGLFIVREILLTLGGAIVARCENGTIHFVVTLSQEPGA